MDHLMITLYNTADDEGEDTDDDEDTCENDAIQALMREAYSSTLQAWPTKKMNMVKRQTDQI